MTLLKTPDFWYQPPSAKAHALAPISALYMLGHTIDQALSNRKPAGIPVLCIGNLVAGGGGKTPTALAIMNLVRDLGLARSPCFLTRGYGGNIDGPIQVDPHTHTADAVGDEPLLLAALAPTFVSKNRHHGATLAKSAAHDLIIMDDGLQNRTLEPDYKIIVIDGASGFGNGLCLPAGPLRTPLHTGLALADAFIVIGSDSHNIMSLLPSAKPIFQAQITAIPPAHPAEPYIAFCGLAQPDKFRRSLTDLGLNVKAFHTFPDHHAYTRSDIDRMAAAHPNARFITTAKDAVKIPKDFIDPANFDILPITLDFNANSRQRLGHIINELRRSDKNQTRA